MRAIGIPLDGLETRVDREQLSTAHNTRKKVILATVKRFYNPWIGETFEHGSGLLLLSESAYKWDDDEPGPDHPLLNTVKAWSLDQERWDRPGRSKGVYARVMTRTLTGEQRPDLAKRTSAWNAVAYSIYVQRVMVGPNARPSKQDLEDGKDAFLDLLELLRPSRVVITTKKVWYALPACDMEGEGEQKAYRLNSGVLSWCLSVPHPQSRNPRYDWQHVHQQLGEFSESSLPKR